LAELQKDARPVLDDKAMEIVRADVKKFYGWDWPEEMDLVTGGKALFEWLMVKANKSVESDKK
jgi:hypothetical protein